MLPPKRKPFTNKPLKAARPIDRPFGDLLRIQSLINGSFLSPILLPEHINGAVKRRTIYKNAECHRGAPLLVTLDIKQCFPSITPIHVYDVWLRTLRCSPRVASILTRLTTFKRHLPQGAPTSPALANLLIWTIDSDVRSKCLELGVTYSTWLDDLAFSGANARDLITPTIESFASHGLKFSHRKIKIMGPREAKHLTGTRAGRHALRVQRSYCRDVRAGIHNLVTGRVEPKHMDEYVIQLLAKLNYIDRVSEADARPLKREVANGFHLLPSAHLPKFAAFVGRLT